MPVAPAATRRSACSRCRHERVQYVIWLRAPWHQLKRECRRASAVRGPEPRRKSCLRQESGLPEARAILASPASFCPHCSSNKVGCNTACSLASRSAPARAALGTRVPGCSDSASPPRLNGPASSRTRLRNSLRHPGERLCQPSHLGSSTLVTNKKCSWPGSLVYNRAYELSWQTNSGG